MGHSRRVRRAVKRQRTINIARATEKKLSPDHAQWLRMNDFYRRFNAGEKVTVP